MLVKASHEEDVFAADYLRPRRKMARRKSRGRLQPAPSNLLEISLYRSALVIATLQVGTVPAQPPVQFTN